MTIGIGILTASKLKESKKLKEESRVKAKSDKDHLRKMERNLYITVVIMQAGFTVTLCKFCSHIPLIGIHCLRPVILYSYCLQAR